jgi:hypothetical protein
MIDVGYYWDFIDRGNNYFLRNTALSEKKMAARNDYLFPIAFSRYDPGYSIKQRRYHSFTVRLDNQIF